MKKFKFSALFSIVLISLLIMGAVSATDTDGVIGIDDVGADDDGILTIDNPDEVIIGDDNSGDNRVEKTLTNLEDDIQAGNDVKLENDTQTSDIANVESDPILGIDAKPGTFTDLQAQIEEAAGGRLVLPYNFAYDPEYDGENFPDGIIIDSNMYIVGSGYTISGSDSNRIFKVTDNSFLQISDVTLTNGAADNGGAVFVDQGSSFTSLQTTFTNNVAVYRGGAVYSEGFVDIYYSVLDGNDVTYRAQNQLNGGAAIYVKNSFLTLLDTRIINNGKNFKYRTTEDEERDLLESVVALVDSSATVRNCLFKNNSACYGGALSIINQDDTLDELIVTNSNFTDNRAYNGAGINIGDSAFNIDKCNFINNQAIGIGSPGYVSVGGGVAFDGAKSEGNIKDSNFTGNGANIGGAIYSGTDDAEHTAVVSGCNFNDNTAIEQGGAIVHVGFLSVSDSNFSGNEAPQGNSIYNGGTLSLDGNVIEDDWGIYLSQNGKMTSEVIITINDNQTYNLPAFTPFTVNAKVTDDNGNIIRTYNDKIGIWCGPSVISGSSPGKLTFNEETGLYEADIEIFKTGQIYMGNTRATFPYADSSLITQKIAYVTVIPVDRLLEVTYENITYPGIVTVNVKLSRNGTPVNQAVKITIAGETKSITPKNGVGSTTFEGLAPGIYEIKATVAANAQYNAIEQLYELAVTPIKGTYTDLQYQIDNAIDGALNLAYNFTYNTSYDGDNFPEGVVITFDLTINGNGYSICGNDSYRIFKVIEGVTLTLNNLTICHGAADDGAGVYVDAGATLNADHVKFIYNNATNRGGAIYSEGTVNINNSLLDSNDITNRAINGNGGAAIFMKNGDLTLLNSNVTNNVKDIVVRNNGGDLISAAVELLDSSATVKGSLFKNNSACYGGAINVNGQNDAATLDVDSCTFIDNFAYNGAGIDINSATFNVKNSTFKGNEVRGTGSAGTLNSCGGAIAMGGDKTTGIINNCTFEENFAEYTGGAILIGSGISNDAQILINDSVFIKNRVLSTTNRGKNLGGAIRDEHYGTIVANSTFKENYANYEGGAIYYNNQYSLTDSCVFEDNEANYMGGAIYYNQYNNKINNSEFSKNIATTNNGGAIALVQARTLSIDNSKFTENEANSGGAIYNGALTITNTSFTSNVARSTSGGAINAYGASTITDSNFTSNSAKTTGGAIWLGNQAHTNIKNSKFDMNTAGSNGGALWANANVGMVYSNFTSNKAVANGGAIYTQKALNIDNGVFDENSAKLGGAIYDNGNLILTDSTLTGNNATQGAAVYIVKAKQATISISEFTDNKCNENSHSIYNDGTLALSRNTISNAIYNNLGTITTQTYTVVLNNETKVVSDAPVTIDVVVLDDNNNKITGFDTFNMTVLIDAVGYKTNATLSDEYVYEVAFTPEALGNYLVSANYSGITGLTNNVLKTGILRNIKGTFTDLAGKITDAILYHDGVLNLTYDFAYTPEIDEVYIEGIVIQGTSLLTVNGNNHTISGSNLSGIFNIQLENVATFNNVTFANAYAGAVLTTSKLIINNCAFINNTDYYDGGYDEGGAISSFTGELVITDSVFINNTARDGGAIDVEGANVTLTNCVFTDNKAVGDGIDSGTGGAISAGNEEQTLTVNNCVFTNNIASTSAVSPEYAPKGGAISSSGHVIINNSNFTNNSADYGGAIEFAFASAEISNSNFTDNTAVYRGGAIYSESTLNVDHCVFDKNDITFRTRNDDNGGAAIYNLNGTLTINNTNITNSVKDIVIRNGNAGDLLVGVVVTSGDTLINNSYFANNTGSWGGAISSLGYMNNNPYTLTVENTKFEGNNATFGGAIFVESSELVVDNCTFENNKGVGVGSSGTSNTQGGAIVVFPSGAKASITNSTFIANSANTGGAVSFAGVDQDSLIDNCTFTDNTASDGGAVYLWTGGDAVVTVKDSDFSGNTAEWGNAISNDGKLALSNNTISSTSADIGDYYGVIVSEINVVVLNNMTVDFIDEVLITAKVTDDNNNLIKDINFDFDINGTIVHAVFNSTSGLYQGTYTNDVLGVYVANMTYPVEENLIVKTATLRNIKGTFTDLAGKILDAIANHDGVLNLTYDFAYYAEFDHEYIYAIPINSTLTINGNNHTINGSVVSRIFQVNAADGVVTFNNITFADSMCAIRTFTELSINDCTFINNDNKYTTIGWGAISSDGGNLTITRSTFDNNTGFAGGAINIDNANLTVTDSVFTNNTASGNQLDGGEGGAIWIGHGSINIDNCVFTDNVAMNSEEDGGSAGAISAGIDTVITNSKFINNSAHEGGAIYVVFGPLEIFNSTFTDNTAESTGIIYNLQSITNIYDCTFNGNKAGDGSTIYSTDETVLSLFNNTISSTKAEIVSGGTINSTINIIVLGNTTVPARIGEKVVITAKVTDDNGNLINDDKFQIVVDGVALSTVYNAETALYEANYTVEIGGQKIVNMTYATTDNLVTYIGILDVPKGNATLIVTVDDILQGENATVTVELYGLNNVKLNETFTVIVNNTEYNVTTVNGTATFNVTDLPAGLYSAVAIFSNQNYNKVINSTIFAVKAETVLTINVENIAYGEDAIIEATLTDKAGNNVTDVVVAVTIDGKTYNIAIENGKGSANVTGLAVGDNYNASAVFEGDINYGASNASDLFNVSKAAASISADVPSEALEGDNVTVTVTVDPSDATGEIKVYVDGKEYGTFNVGDEIIIEDLTNGTHIVGVQYTGDDNYNASEIMNYSIRVKVNLTESDVRRLGSIGPYGTNSSVIMEIFYEDATGNVTVIVDGVPYTGVLDDGEVLIMLPVLDVGDYDNLPFIYSGDDKYTGVNTYVGVFVLPIDTEVVVTPSENNKVGDVANVTVTVVPKFGDSDVTVYIDKDNNTIEKANDAASVVPEYPTGSVTIVIDGIAYDPLDLVNGTVTMPVSGLAVGNHTVSAYYEGDEIFAESVGNNTLEVTKAEPNMNVSVEVGTVLDDVNVTVDVPDDATGYVLIKVDDKPANFAEIENGVAKAAISDLSPGPHNVTVTYLGDDNYSNETCSTSLNMEKAPTNTTINVTVDGFDVEITVNVNSTEVVDGGSVTLTFNNKNSTATVVDGVAVFKFKNLDAKTYSIVASYEGNNKFLPSNATGSVKLVRIASYIKPVYKPFIFNYGQLYKFRLVDKEGNGIAGRTIEFSVHSKVYYVKTGKDGWGQIQLTTEMLIHADKIFSRLIFRGDSQYRPSTYAVWFNAMKEPSKFVDVKPIKASYKVSESKKQITATLKDSKDKGIGGKQVSINIGGKTITAKTNSNGVVIFNVGSVKFNVGSNAFTLLFEDVNYKKASYWGTINIVKD
ncbi:Ig-like domain repeat protein [uncultured Methanobrevibacter sp.]|uniref:Ig-like domain repeat protein n=1 Tax=uncultured Methanobrevibacter sp. TaxID=253161 RepID=UPI0026210B64|nr:Ig-like domain repeat protein [uncultured Methanobrevibacter sp.]